MEERAQQLTPLVNRTARAIAMHTGLPVDEARQALWLEVMEWAPKYPNDKVLVQTVAQHIRGPRGVAGRFHRQMKGLPHGKPLNFVTVDQPMYDSTGSQARVFGDIVPDSSNNHAEQGMIQAENIESVRLLVRIALQQLPPRTCQVAELLSRGIKKVEIARALKVSPATVTSECKLLKQSLGSAYDMYKDLR